MKVDLNRLRELKAQFAAMDRRLEEIVASASREAMRVAESTKGRYGREHGIDADCDAVVSAALELFNQGEKLSWMLRTKGEGLSRAIEGYAASEKIIKSSQSKIAWGSKFAGLDRWIKNGTTGAVGAKVKEKNLTREDFYSLIVPCHQMDSGSWTNSALNLGWGPVRREEHDKRLQGLISNGDTVFATRLYGTAKGEKSSITSGHLNKVGVTVNVVDGIADGMTLKNIRNVTAKVSPVMDIAQIGFDAHEQIQLEQPIWKGVTKVGVHATLNIGTGVLTGLVALAHGAAYAGTFGPEAPLTYPIITTSGIASVWAVNKAGDELQSNFDSWIDEF